MTDIALFTVDDDGVVNFSLRNIMRTVEGPEEALQLVAWSFFTTPGSCVYARNDGGGFLEMLKGQNIPNQQQLRADAAVRLKSTLDTVRRAQRDGRPANATITGLELIDAYGDRETGKIFIKARIRLLSGNSFAATLPVTGATP